MKRIKIFTVATLDWACERTHWLTLHRPWLWVFRNCPLACRAFDLDERWFPAGDGYYKRVE